MAAHDSHLDWPFFDEAHRGFARRLEGWAAASLAHRHEAMGAGGGEQFVFGHRGSSHARTVCGPGQVSWFPQFMAESSQARA